jgi:hypothetical protein
MESRGVYKVLVETSEETRPLRTVFLNRRALASIKPVRER